ncbi:Na+/H+ antiporter NhaC family protein [uncultured Ilyobacter sp.]|uniref:Na+/H+ antiporter NhaC family protein n=1 Tax=uncultured Ilyobacter sp. TaxID=544433 RepID=UPI0029C8F15A|nr:Na+/H+ antiporter NhaC family protein [uncultured Ilyobacter sp.]
MDILISMAFIFSLLIFSVINKIFIGYPLFIALFIFSLLSIKRGYYIKDVIKMIFDGGKKSFIVLQVFSLIGILTSLWIAAGTIPTIVYYGIKFMNPNFFIIYTFLIVSFVSLLLGTSFGTASTIGVAIIVMAKAGNINLAIVTGAIMSGAYFGDRCSPMSSSAILIANLTETDLYTNIKNMLKTGVLPLIISSIFYFILSFDNPIVFTQENIGGSMKEAFSIGLVPLIPAAIIFVASLFKVNVKKSMTISIISAVFISIFLQNHTLLEVINFSIFGFKLENSVKIGNILNRGGIVSMIKAGVVVFISCSLAGIFNRTAMLEKFHGISLKSKNRFELFSCTIITSILTGIFGCSQTISTVLTEQFLKDAYKKLGYGKDKLALDLENTSIVIAPLIPWNIAAFVPTETLKVNFYSYIPYAFYLYLVPLSSFLVFKFQNYKLKVKENTL